jgi:hypothetical protein
VGYGDRFPHTIVNYSGVGARNIGLVTKDFKRKTGFLYHKKWPTLPEGYKEEGNPLEDPIWK